MTFYLKFNLVFFLPFFAILLILMGCESSNYVLFQNGQKVFVEVAADDDERTEGLMFREELGSNEGMLFIYDAEQAMRFWMKNTLLPLDIFFLNSERTVVDIQTMLPCKADPCPTYLAKEKAMFALEVHAGKADEWKVKIGDQLEFSW